MNLTDHGEPGHPGLGSTGWAASRIERLLEDEARRRRMAWADEARHRPLPPRPAAPTRHVHPVGSTAWGAQEMLRRLEAAESRTGNDAGLGPEETPAEAISQTEIPPMVTNRAPRYRGELMPGLRGEPLLNNQETSELAFSTIPLIGDAYGLYRDVETFANDPASRTLGNYVLGAVGLLPYVPSSTARLARTGKKLSHSRKAPDLESLGLRLVKNRHGRRGDPFTREVVQFTEKRIIANNPDWLHLGGGTRGEIARPGPGRSLGKHLSPPSKDGRAGSRFADLLFFDPKGNRLVAFQIVRTDSHGIPLMDEQLAARDLARRGIDVYYVFPPLL